jgi:hypothetical protein
LEKQQNINCLYAGDYARASMIAADYDWPVSFVVQMALIAAIASSTRLPAEMVTNAREEIGYFNEYLNKYFT